MVNSKNFGYSIPEMSTFIMKYGERLSANPPYVLLGKYKSTEKGYVMGVLACANNEFHAHILRKEFNKNGSVTILKTVYHADGDGEFDVDLYKEKMKMAKAKAKELGVKGLD